MLPSDLSAAMAADTSLGLMVDRRAPSVSRLLPAGLEMLALLDQGAGDPEIRAWLVRASNGGPLPVKVEGEAFGTQVRLMDRLYLPKLRDSDLVKTMFDVVADIYDDLTTLAVNVGTASALLQAALEEAGPDPLVLDFGCGTGLAATSLEAIGRRARLLGVDISSAMLQRAAARGETVIAIDEWRQSPPPVDAAIAAFVLHYGVMAEDLARIAGSLPPGGRFAANFFRAGSGDIHELVRRLATEHMVLVGTAEIGGTKAANVMLVFRKRR